MHRDRLSLLLWFQVVIVICIFRTNVTFSRRNRITRLKWIGAINYGFLWSRSLCNDIADMIIVMVFALSVLFQLSWQSWYLLKQDRSSFFSSYTLDSFIKLSSWERHLSIWLLQWQFISADSNVVSSFHYQDALKIIFSVKGIFAG